MEKFVFIGYPQGYKGWKLYNPTTKKVVISERADFNERYFPMSKRPTTASFPAPSAEVENTPSATPAPVPRTSPAVPKPASNHYYFPLDSDDSDSDDEFSSDESLDHGGDMAPPAPLVVDAVAPAPAPELPQTPPHPASPVAPPRVPSPIGIGARLPRRKRTKPREWWKLSAAQLDLDIDDDIEDTDLAYEVAYSSTAAAEPLSYSEALRRPDAEQWKAPIASPQKALGSPDSSNMFKAVNHSLSSQSVALYIS